MAVFTQTYRAANVFFSGTLSIFRQKLAKD